jgi:hypothetical protein
MGRMPESEWRWSRGRKQGLPREAATPDHRGRLTPIMRSLRNVSRVYEKVYEWGQAIPALPGDLGEIPCNRKLR